jgi:EmrB/QacA subfamily drug resistance transporter
MTDPADRASRSILLVLFVGVLMGALDIAIVGPALPALRAEFGVDERAISWTFNIYVLFNLMGTPIMAKLSDRLGRRLVYVADILLFALGSLVVALAPTFEVLLVGRALQAFGAGGIFPVASAVIGDTLPPEKRGRALGLIGAVFGIAFLLGPFIAAGLLTFSWHWLFLINLPIAAILIVAGLRVLPSARQANPAPFDVAGAFLLSLALAGLAIGINAIDSSRLGASLASLSVWPFLAVAVVAFLVLLPVERRAADPVLRPGWFASRQVKLVALFSAGAGLGEAAMVFIPDLAVSALHLTPRAASFLVLPVVLATALGSPIFGRLLDRIGPRPIVITALFFLGGGSILFGLLETTRTALILGGTGVGLGLSGLLGAPLRYILLDEVAPEERGSAQGILTVFISVGQLLSGALIGAVAASQGGGAAGYREAFLIVGVVTVAMMLFAYGLKKKVIAKPAATEA